MFLFEIIQYYSGMNWKKQDAPRNLPQPVTAAAGCAMMA
jgi:hypothetical protein